MQTHRSSNDGAAGLIWLKRSPNVRGIVGFDLSCLDLQSTPIECAELEVSVYNGKPTNKGSWFSAHRMNAEWVEGNQSFNKLRANGETLGSFGGTGTGTTWDCRVDDDLADAGNSNCSGTDRWFGGEDCDGGPCYQQPASDDVLWADKQQAKLSFDVTADMNTGADQISWLLKVQDETTSSGSVKFYTRDGAQFLAEVDPQSDAEAYLDLAPRLVLWGADIGAPGIDLLVPTRPTGDPVPSVVIHQTGPSIGDTAGWRNLTTGGSGAMTFGTFNTWSAPIPLQLGLNDIEITVYDECGGEGRATFPIRYSTGEICGDWVIGPDEQCDDGNLADGDCCSSTCRNEPQGASCDDGDACTVAESCSQGACVTGGTAPLSCGNAHLCYDANETKGTTAFAGIEALSLADALGAGLFDVKRLSAVCPPAEVDGARIVTTESHRLTYDVKRSSGQAKLPAWKGVLVHDALGELTVDTQGADLLLSSGTLGLGSVPAPPTDTLADPYLCHRVKVSSSADFPDGQQVRVMDSFEDRLYDVKKPLRLCLAATVGGAAPANPDLHVMCYKAVRAAEEPKHRKRIGEVRTADLFGDLELDTRVESELCLPASIEPPP